jgi:hypothetical protein
MKKSTTAILTIASLAGMAGLASAGPVNVNELQNGGLGISQSAQSGGGPNTGQAAQSFGTSIPTNFSQASQNNLTTVPEPSSLLLLGEVCSCWLCGAGALVTDWPTKFV